MLLQILVAFSILANCQAYRDDSPNYKWSPNYFGALGKSAPVIYSSRLSTPRRVGFNLISTRLCHVIYCHSDKYPCLVGIGLTHNTGTIHTSFIRSMEYGGNVSLKVSFTMCTRECVSTGAAGARTHRSLGHHLLHPLILRLLVLCALADFEAQSSLL
jgi:hypothetical protein